MRFHWTSILFVHASYSLKLCCLLAGFAFELNIAVFLDVDTSATWGHVPYTGTKISVFLSAQNAAGNSDKPQSCMSVAVTKTPMALLPWKSLCQTQLPTAHFSIHRHGFAVSSASGNLTENEPQRFSYVINSFHPRSMTGPFPQVPVNSSSLVSTFCLTVKIIVKIIFAARFFGHVLPCSKRPGLHLSCAGCFQSQKHFLWMKFHPFVFSTSLRHLLFSCLVCISLFPSLPVSSFSCQPWGSFQRPGEK